MIPRNLLNLSKTLLSKKIHYNYNFYQSSKFDVTKNYYEILGVNEKADNS